ncbi:hypothetical protein SMUDGE_226 [Bacillus phage Smudge]|uniref:Uncharacterized protein n=1 Tax=Bacillus phage Smudge TaxID=1852566 RepID=A0A173H2X4_9CAUD|nr:hypothetical protein BI001_gp147 [Bacillus phage Zuko]ANI24845.1 hypothetical protein SMUDGE_226 [Bacillus phage Smudge]AOZ61853.1 hypothetical protein BJ4_230 [Bacillus phage BJ4]AOZ62481.1 hypothetical protein SBP8a_231 [Bacillus phage SBP8a]ASR78949.1 hypothetical protein AARONPHADGERS_238 [Bacillus phage AaronPhadgers]AUV57864.1 hypothetical protein HONESTABE_227 [Bacillus phage HonestAbe]UGO46476.1 hypothetical protein ABINADI_159 [Bacillus phage vB_BanH_Abinadi]
MDISFTIPDFWLGVLAVILLGPPLVWCLLVAFVYITFKRG